MKRNKSKVLMLSLSVFLLATAANAEEKAMEVSSDKDKLSYTIGIDIARSLAAVKDEVDLDKVILGVKDRFNGIAPKVSEEEMLGIMQEFAKKMQAKMMEEMKNIAETNTIEGENFLKENKEKEGVVTTDSGLQYMVEKEGEGKKPAATDKVTVHYRGTTINGEEFDSSYKRGQPASFPVTGVIPGWTEALQLMSVGSKYKLFIPSALAYGERGSGGAIGPNAVLVFEVELLGIE